MKENKTDRLCIRTTKSNKLFIDRNKLSPTKIFDDVIKLLMEQEENLKCHKNYQR